MRNLIYYFFVSLFVLGGCSGSNKSDEENVLNNSTEAEVIIRLGMTESSPAGRMLGTYKDIYRITLSWENLDQPDSNSIELEQIDGIWTGSIGGSITVGETYDFTAEAFNDISDRLFRGITTHTVSSGGNNLNIGMVPEDDGTGSSIPVITNLAVPAGFLPGETLQIDFTIKGDSDDSLSLDVYGFRGSAISSDSQFEAQEIDLSFSTSTTDGAYNIYSGSVNINIPAEITEDVITFIFQVRTEDGPSSELNFTVQRGATGQEKFLNFLPVPTQFILNQVDAGDYQARLEFDYLDNDSSSGLTWSAQIEGNLGEYLMDASVSPNSGYLMINFTTDDDYYDVFLVISVSDPNDPDVTAHYKYNIPQLTFGSVIDTIGTLEYNNYLTYNGLKKYLQENPIISGTSNTDFNMWVIDPSYDIEFHNSGSNSITVSSENIYLTLQPGERHLPLPTPGLYSELVNVTTSDGGSFLLEVKESLAP